MDPETWIVLVVPALAAIAAGDSVIGLSTSLAGKLGLRNELWIHIAILAFGLATFILFLLRLVPHMDRAFMLADYVYPQNHWFSQFVAPWIMIAEVLLLIPSCMIAALLISARRRRTMRRSLLLSVAAAMLGNIGTIVWLLRARYREVVVWKRIDDEMAVRVTCLEDMASRKFVVHGADFFAAPPKVDAMNQTGDSKWFDSIEAAVSAHEEEFRSLRKAL